MASLPPVKLDTHEDWFNLLMTVLHQQAEQNPYEEYREMAQKLIDQFMRYGRPFVDSDHAPCVALRMYPKEAGNTIWLLLLSLCNQYACPRGRGENGRPRGARDDGPVKKEENKCVIKPMCCT